MDLFDELDQRDLKTTAAITAAYKSDDAFLGRIVNVALWTKELSRWYSGKIRQVITSSDRLRPYFVRERVCEKL